MISRTTCARGQDLCEYIRKQTRMCSCANFTFNFNDKNMEARWRISAIGVSCQDTATLPHYLICPGLEPGISGSGGRRLIHQANRPYASSLKKIPQSAALRTHRRSLSSHGAGKPQSTENPTCSSIDHRCSSARPASSERPSGRSTHNSRNAR